MKLKRERASLPQGYVAADAEAELLPWSYVDDRMAAARHYWLCTVSSGGAPHSRPVGGMWLDGKLYLGGSPQSKWARNLLENPRVCLNLSEVEGEADQTVILHGRIEVRRADHELGTRLVAASNEKYPYEQTVEQYEGEIILELVPETVFAWTELGNATRWSLEE